MSAFGNQGEESGRFQPEGLKAAYDPFSAASSGASHQLDAMFVDVIHTPTLDGR